MRTLITSFLILSATSATGALPPEKNEPEYLDNCAVCHGERLQGTAQGAPLTGELLHGASIGEIMASIAQGFPDKGMPAFFLEVWAL